MVPTFIIVLFWTVIVVCTAAFYGWFALFGYLAIKNGWRGGHGRKAAVYGCIACLPAVWYGAAYLSAINKHAQLDAQVVDAQKLPKLIDAPRTLVLHGGGRSEWQEQLIQMGAVDEIFVNWPGQRFRLANGRGTSCDRGTRGGVSVQNLYRARTGFLVCAVQSNADAIPESGLHLHMTPRSQVQKDWINYFDLWMVEGGQRRLIGFHGTPYVHYPVFPPVLSGIGFMYNSFIEKSPVPWHGEIPFLFERLGLDIDRLRPLAQPAAEEVRAEFLRLRDSPQRADQRVAGFIARAVGASVLSPDDVLPVIQSDAIDYDFGRLVGSRQFCESNDKLCDFADLLTTVCRSKSKPPAQGPYKNAARLCDRIPEQCNRCKTALLCQPYLTGKVTGCSKEDNAASAATMSPLRQF